MYSQHIFVVQRFTVFKIDGFIDIAMKLGLRFLSKEKIYKSLKYFSLHY